LVIAMKQYDAAAIRLLLESGVSLTYRAHPKQPSALQIAILDGNSFALGVLVDWALSHKLKLEDYSIFKSKTVVFVALLRISYLVLCVCVLACVGVLVSVYRRDGSCGSRLHATSLDWVSGGPSSCRMFCYRSGH
jgi:hypothetical protein